MEKMNENNIFNFARSSLLEDEQIRLKKSIRECKYIVFVLMSDLD